MQKKYVSLSKLSTFLDNLKTTFSALGHKHAITDVTDLQSTLDTINENVGAKTTIQIITWGADD